jgi:glycosyltransferase involved in cell wall biosynthesis
VTASPPSLRVGFDASCAAVARPTGVGWAVTHLARALHAVAAEEGLAPRTLVRWSRARRRGPLVERSGAPVTLFDARWSLLLARTLDVLHGPDARLPALRGPALVATVHDLSARRPGFCEARFRATREAHWADVAARADLVVAYTAAVKAELVAALGLAPERVAVVPLAPVSAPAAAGDVERVRRDVTGGRPWVLVLGERSRRKNCAGALRAFAAAGEPLRDHALVLAGPDGHGHEEVTATLAALPDLAPRVVVAPWLAPADVAGLLAGATALLFPTRYEGFGLPVLEAFAAGTPVVASRDPSVVEVAGGAAIHQDAEDPDGLGAALREACARRDELAAAGRRRAAAFTWEGAARRLAAVYRAARAGGHAPVWGPAEREEVACRG